MAARRPAGGARWLAERGRLSLDGLITHHSAHAARGASLPPRPSATPTA
jgi:hypothetical protein